MHDERGEWLVKFPSPSRDGIHDVVGLEAMCLELARAAELTVPESHLVSVGRRRVLLVRRFDVTARGGRFHMVSFRTLCGERPGLFVTEYSEFVQVLRRISASPAADVGALFRHMVFNAAIGNVDDHLKNFWMLADSNVGYRLAPAFDLVPDVTERRDHTLAFRSGFGCPTRKVLLELAAAWDISHARDIVEQVTDSVSAFSKAARRLGVRRPASVGLIAADVHRRLRLMGS